MNTIKSPHSPGHNQGPPNKRSRTTAPLNTQNEVSKCLKDVIGFIACDKVQSLMNKGADVSKPAENGCTLLHLAAEHGHTDIFNALLTALISRNEEINPKDNSGITPFHKAAEHGHSAIFNALLTALISRNEEIDPADEYGWTPLQDAIQNKRTAIARALITALDARGAEVNLADKYGRTPLYLAAHYGLTDIVRMLQECSGDINQVDNDGCSPLYQAAKNGHKEIVQYLVKEGAAIRSERPETSPIKVAATSDVLWEMVSTQENKLTYFNLADEQVRALPYQRAVLFNSFESLIAAQKRLILATLGSQKGRHAIASDIVEEIFKHERPLTCEEARYQTVDLWLNQDRELVTLGKDPIHKNSYDMAVAEGEEMNFKKILRKSLELNKFPEDVQVMFNKLNPVFLKYEKESKKEITELKKEKDRRDKTISALEKEIKNLKRKLLETNEPQKAPKLLNQKHNSAIDSK